MVRQTDLEEARVPEQKRQAVHGVKWDRPCTDGLCCLVFLVVLIVMGIVTEYVIENGDPVQIMTPFDSQGNRCGMPNQGVDRLPANQTDFSAYKYKHFTNLIRRSHRSFYESVCVRDCPTLQGGTDCMTTKEVEKCPQSPYQTEVFFGYCLPSRRDSVDILNQVISQLGEQSTFGFHFIELQECWREVGIMCVMTLVIAIVYILLLKFVTKPLLYSSMMLVLALFILIGIWQWRHQFDFDEDTDNYTYARAGAFVAWTIALLYCACIFFNGRSITLSATVMEAAAEFVSENVEVLLMPIIVYALSAGFFIFWVIAVVYLYSIGQPMFQPNSFFANIIWDDETAGLMVFMCLALLWVISFIANAHQYALACMACMWYYSQEDSDTNILEPLEIERRAPRKASLGTAASWAIIQNSGSVAIGSLVIPLFSLLRQALWYLLDKSLPQGNPAAEATGCCVGFLGGCLDCFIKYISKHAYISIAISGNGFCDSAKEAFYLLVRNSKNFGFASVVGWIVMLLGKGAIMGAAGTITLVFLRENNPNITQPFVPTIIVLVFAYLVASLFLSVFSFSSIAILHCFLVDKDSGNGRATPPCLLPFLEYTERKRGETNPERKKRKKRDDRYLVDSSTNSKHHVSQHHFDTVSPAKKVEDDDDRDK